MIAAKVVVSTILLGWILSRSDFGEIFAAASGANVRLLLAAYVLNFVGILISALRWRGLLQAHGVTAPVGFLVKSVMVGVFFNNFLPSTVGGDAMRAYDSYRLTQRSGPMTSVVVDRLLGVLVLTIFALVSLPFAPQLSGRVPMLPLWVAGGAALLVGLAWAIFAAPSSGAPERLVSRLPSALAKPLRRVLGPFGAYRGQRPALVRAFGWSLLLQANVIIYYVVVARAFGFAVPVHHFFLIVPLALYVMMVPITVNGIGLRENVLALFLAAYGIGNADAVAYAWLVYLGGLIQGLIGGVVYAVRRVEPGLPPVTPPVGHRGADG
jgi:hypothetical protein